MLYHIEFAIEVDGPDAKTACTQAWALLTAPDAMLPVGKVVPFDGSGDGETVDLQELSDIGSQNPSR